MRTLVLAAVAIFVFGSLYFEDLIRLQIYKSQSNVLINFDYGILSMEDLKRFENTSAPAKAFDGSFTGYTYWQCFNKKYLKFECDYIEPRDQPGSSISLEVETDDEIHSYSIPHAIPGDTCDFLLARIRRVLSDQTYFCINGREGALDRTGEKREYSWTFNRLKTKSGYARYMSYEGEPEDPE
jgi:hypothetical protein